MRRAVRVRMHSRWSPVNCCWRSRHSFARHSSICPSLSSLRRRPGSGSARVRRRHGAGVASSVAPATRSAATQGHPKVSRPERRSPSAFVFLQKSCGRGKISHFSTNIIMSYEIKNVDIFVSLFGKKCKLV